MAYAAVISLKLTLHQILLHPQSYSISREKKLIKSFHEKLEFLQQFLEEYPPNETIEKIRYLERRITDVAYEAEDFMDLRWKNPFESKNSFVNLRNFLRNLRVMHFAAFKSDASLCIKLIAKVDSIIGEVMEIKRGRGSFLVEEMKFSRFGKHEEFKPRNAFRKDPSRDVSSDTKKLMVGFDDYLMQIKDQLTGQSSTLEVISVVGMGGVGKTTLATHVYNDPYVVKHFDIRSWVTVSQSYSVRDILLRMLDSMKMLSKEMDRQSTTDEQLGLDVYQNLKGRRYLITIDDIWDTKAWDDLKRMFPDDQTGSRVVLTTRISNVAEYACPSGNPHQINPLQDEQSWMLLRAKVFGEEPCPLNLQEIGKLIAHSCRGLPLSIVVIGGLLSKVEKTQIAWQAIAEDVSSFVFSSDDQCSDIVRLSYNYLPQHLKACFLYMGVFPKTYEILVSKLTKMWAAEGFLRRVDGQSPEDVAERCVEDLFDRSLLLMSKKNFEGKIKSFRIHDLLLDFCVKEAKDEKFLQITKSPGDIFPRSSSSERRISIHLGKEFENSRFDFESKSSTTYVRSLVCLGRCYLSSNLLSRFRLLRVLDAINVDFYEFPEEVLELQNLRYIALYCGGDIPASILKLCNLQTLIISGSFIRSSKKLNSWIIWMMVHLRHIWFEEGHWLDASSINFQLNHEDLQTLSGLWNMRFTKEILHSIPNIKKIYVLYDSSCCKGKGWSYYQFENLGNLHHLKALKIRASPDLLKSSNLIPPSFQFPPSLKTLTLRGVGIPWHDLAIIGSLPSLEVLKLKDRACLGTEWEPNEGGFCELKHLVLEDLNLKHWKADSDHFPSLQRLIIRRCDSLVEIPSGMGESSTLATIGLSKCNASVLASANEILEIQLSYGNDDFQVINADPKGNSLWRRARRSLHTSTMLQARRSSLWNLSLGLINRPGTKMRSV